MGKKQSSFDKVGIENLAKDKPVVYKLQDDNGETIYVGIAKRGRVGDRLSEHLSGRSDAVPGAKKVTITQHDSIDSARRSEERIIERTQPRHNKKGK